MAGDHDHTRRLPRHQPEMSPPHRSCVGCADVGVCRARAEGRGTRGCGGFSPSEGMIRLLGKILSARVVVKRRTQ